MGIRKSYLVLAILVMAILSGENAPAQQKDQVIRIARLVIDSAQIENYKTILKEAAETAIRVEPGVLTLYAVYEKTNPTRVTVFEIYANEEAYQSHLRAPHFLKYKAATKEMVKSLELVETSPIVLGRK